MDRVPGCVPASESASASASRLIRPNRHKHHVRDVFGRTRAPRCCFDAESAQLRSEVLGLAAAHEHLVTPDERREPLENLHAVGRRACDIAHIAAVAAAAAAAAA
eukprot:2227938-Pleurochrysis_carterae.AAC.1